MLDLRQVRTFVAVARQGSFTRAANLLHYAQSSVTAQIKLLEEQLEVPLLDRLPRGVEVTVAGHAFLPHAERLLAMEEETRHAVARQAAPSGQLTLSASESVLTYRMPELLRRFQREFPAVTIALQSASMCDDGPPLGPGVDIAISINEPVRDPALVTEVLRPERVCVVVSRDHALAALKTVTAAAIAAEQLLLTEDSCSYRAIFERALAQAGAHPSRSLEFASVEAIRQCARARMGVAVLPEMVIADDLRKGTLVALPWAHGPMRVYTQLVRRRSKWVSPAMEAFWAMAAEMLPNRRKTA